MMTGDFKRGGGLKEGRNLSVRQLGLRSWGTLSDEPTSRSRCLREMGGLLMFPRWQDEMELISRVEQAPAKEERSLAHPSTHNRIIMFSEVMPVV